MPINNLKAQYRHNGTANQPVLLLVHGWDGQIMGGGDTDSYFLDRMAKYGVFACSVGMRGRAGADGSRDASGREIHDLYDALLYIREHFAGYVSDKAAIMGISGGGGNALAAACKFPDTWNATISIHGMSDYGRNSSHSWYYNGWAGYATAMREAIGGSPAEVPNAYYAREATAAITNYNGGELILFHDENDGIVPIVHSERIVSALDSANLTNCTAHFSGSESNPRWSHGIALDSAAMLAAEALYIPAVLNTPAWTVPASGTLTVLGYLVTKRFSLWLNEGLDAVATVEYGVTPDTYIVTPLAGTPDVTITQADGKTGSATAINGATEIVVG